MKYTILNTNNNYIKEYDAGAYYVNKKLYPIFKTAFYLMMLSHVDRTLQIGDDIFGYGDIEDNYFTLHFVDGSTRIGQMLVLV